MTQCWNIISPITVQPLLSSSVSQGFSMPMFWSERRQTSWDQDRHQECEHWVARAFTHITCQSDSLGEEKKKRQCGSSFLLLWDGTEGLKPRGLTDRSDHELDLTWKRGARSGSVFSGSSEDPEHSLFFEARSCISSCSSTPVCWINGPRYRWLWRRSGLPAVEHSQFLRFLCYHRSFGTAPDLPHRAA